MLMMMIIWMINVMMTATILPLSLHLLFLFLLIVIITYLPARGPNDGDCAPLKKANQMIVPGDRHVEHHGWQLRLS
jgi:hypothetical protein